MKLIGGSERTAVHVRMFFFVWIPIGAPATVCPMGAMLEMRLDDVNSAVRASTRALVCSVV